MHTKRDEDCSLGQGFLFSIDLLFNQKHPHLAACISLVLLGFGAVGQLLLGQEAKAGVLLMIEWLVILPVGLLVGLLPYFLLGFHLLVALDVWVMAGRVSKGKYLRKWEWFWNRS